MSCHELALLFAAGVIWTCSGCTLHVEPSIPDAHIVARDAQVDAPDAPDPCPGPAEYRRGRCLEPDPLGETCEWDSWCDAGDVCVDGRCTRDACHDEECDGVDNDCDGLADEGPLARYCADDDSPWDPSLLPPCAQGAQVCAAGEWSACLGAVSPVPEAGLLACDHQDNDCDGAIDEDAAPVGIDVAFLIDTSGSMAGTIAAVRVAADGFASTYAGGTFRYALVAFPGPTARDPLVVVDMTDAANFRAALSGLSTWGGGDEPSIDAIEFAAAALSWRPGATRILILASDEVPQSYEVPERDLSATCLSLASGEVVIVLGSAAHSRAWGMCGGATVLELTHDGEAMRALLAASIREPC